MLEDTAVLCLLLRIIYYFWLVIEIHGKESVMNKYRLVSAAEKTITNVREEFVSSQTGLWMLLMMVLLLYMQAFTFQMPLLHPYQFTPLPFTLAPIKQAS